MNTANNARIAQQIELAYQALEQLTGAGVQVRHIRLSQDVTQPAISCVAAHTADQRTEWIGGCRIDWTAGAAVQACRFCGCTHEEACTDHDGGPCWWVQPGLCSVCARSAGIDVDTLRAVGAEADVSHAIAGVARGELPR